MDIIKIQLIHPMNGKSIFQCDCLPAIGSAYCLSLKKIPSRGALKSLLIKDKIKIIFLILVFWICCRRIRARNKPVKYRNVYKVPYSMLLKYFSPLSVN